MIINKPLLNGVKRNSLDIDRDILEYLILHPYGEKHTNLLFKCNLSYIQSTRFFDRLKKDGFIIKMGTANELMPKRMWGIRSSTNGVLMITKRGIDRYIQLRLLEVPNE